MNDSGEKQDPLTTSNGQIMVIEGLDDDDDMGFNPNDTTLYRAPESARSTQNTTNGSQSSSQMSASSFERVVDAEN